MRPLSELDSCRAKLTGADPWLYGEPGNDLGGAFEIEIGGAILRVIASNGDGWDHISVSVKDRCPRWDEMELVKRLFFRPNEVAMQLHMPPKDHINVHPYCLHVWRPHGQPIPLPPTYMV